MYVFFIFGTLRLIMKGQVDKNRLARESYAMKSRRNTVNHGLTTSITVNHIFSCSSYWQVTVVMILSLVLSHCK